MAHTINLGRRKFLQRSENIYLLKEVASNYKTGKLQIVNSTNAWTFFWEEGYCYYAVSSTESTEIFLRKLQGINQINPIIQAHIQQQVKNNQATQADSESEDYIGVQNYLVICWLVNQQYLTIAQASKIIEEIINEVIDSFLKAREGTPEFTQSSFMDDMPKFCHFDVIKIAAQYTNWFADNLEFGQQLSTKLLSPPQTALSTSLEVKDRLLFTDLTPQELFEQQPDIQHQQSEKINPIQTATPNPILQTAVPKLTTPPESSRKIYKVLCIDDSPMILKAIRGYLDEQIFNVIGVDDSLKALVEILRHQPDVILLDISMPNLDGYELCSLLRKHAKFHHTPIIMVTGRTGFVDKARAKLVKSSGYLTKPFSKAELLKVLFHNLASLEH